MGRARTAALHGWGVAAGLRVTATAGAAGVTVAPGTALDAAGNQIVLAEGGAAVVDQSVDPAQVQNVPTAVVAAGGVTLDTSTATGDVVLTLAWREVLGDNDWVNAPALVHAPWLQLIPAAGFTDDGRRVPLARLTLAAGGVLADGGLTAGPRRAAGVPASRLELRAPRATTEGGPAVDQV